MGCGASSRRLSINHPANCSITSEEGGSWEPPLKPGPKVFLSYFDRETGSSADGSAQRLQADLEAAGYCVITHDGPQLLARIRACPAFIALCSPTYGEEMLHPEGQRELQLAEKCRAVVLPLCHSGSFPPDGMTLHLRGFKRVAGPCLTAQAPGSWEAAVESLLTRLRSALQPRSSSTSSLSSKEVTTPRAVQLQDRAAGGAATPHHSQAQAPAAPAAPAEAPPPPQAVPPAAPAPAAAGSIVGRPLPPATPLLHRSATHPVKPTHLPPLPGQQSFTAQLPKISSFAAPLHK